MQNLIGLEDRIIKLNDLEKVEIIQQLQMDLWISVKSIMKLKDYSIILSFSTN
ncbi:unnamed protein product [Paramecium pentaurelia]|uniref:Uncharacterized protein n=1 Tax=Paramecium pentaurelia TaxID=43138 RepID=A0A8S1VAH6_9CILI|nr:unnamed protein product [Paramecium pentaurelia]